LKKTVVKKRGKKGMQGDAYDRGGQLESWVAGSKGAGNSEGVGKKRRPM